MENLVICIRSHFQLENLGTITIAIAIETLERGSKLVDDKIVVDEQKKVVDEKRRDSQVTMEIGMEWQLLIL